MANLGNINYVLTLAVGSLLAINGVGGLTLGALASFLQLTRSFNMPITQVSQQFNSIVMALAGAERIFDLLDEPEAALSPQRQLTLLICIHRLAREGSQFLIATHSPILLGLPKADILSFDGEAVHPVEYTDTDSYQVTEMFLNHREYLLKRLLDETEC